MLFLYGWQKKRIGVTPITHHNCISCNTKQSLFIETFRSYVHFFWLPLIPMFKTSSSYCGHCKQVLGSNEMPPDLKNSAQEIKKTTATPWYFFATPLVVFSLIIFLTTNIL